MPYGWFTLCRSAQGLVQTCLRDDKSSVGKVKVGTRWEVPRGESLTSDRNMCECGARQRYGKIATFGLFDGVPGCCTASVLGTEGPVLAVLCL